MYQCAVFSMLRMFYNFVTGMQKKTDMIETERLLLRPWTDSDAGAMYIYASDPDIGFNGGWPVHTSVENSLEFIHTVFSAPEVYAVVLKDTNEPVGSVGILFQDSKNTLGIKEGEIAYWIGKPFWGKGLIPEAVKALLSKGFKELGLEKMWCVYYEDNTKSKRVCEKCGFVFHHINKGVVTPLGDIRTEICCLLTKDDYERI